MGQAYDDEVRALAASRIEAMLDASNGEKEGA
jgi:hypothetical protein